LDHLATIHENAFDYLKECDGKKRRFDGICLDPPAFVKGRADLQQAARGYKEINLRAMRLLRPGGILVTSSCSQNLHAEEFEQILLDAARDTRRQVQVLTRLGQPADHPSLLAMPETNYLKCHILRIL
jgi:23S rRNA (cytosine1962-C5)-methyltransferase